VPDDESEPQPHQEVRASGDAFTAGRDQVIHQYLGFHPDVASLEALSPAIGAELLARLAADDKTFNNAAVMLKAASVARGAEVLQVLLADDEDLVISLLARIDPVRARELAQAAGPDPAWLAELPTAVAAIQRCESAARTQLGRRVGWPLRASPHAQGPARFTQHYDHGLVCWTALAGAHAIWGPIVTAYELAGWTDGPLGFPVGDQTGMPSLRAETGADATAACQEFEGGVICYRDGGAHLVRPDVAAYLHRDPRSRRAPGRPPAGRA
jgi:hypothetical protein